MVSYLFELMDTNIYRLPQITKAKLARALKLQGFLVKISS
jgi:hypothetical protein